MIAIFILAVLSVLTAQSIQSSLRNKVKIQRDIERESVVRDALRVVQRDINLAFHYQDLTYEMLKAIDQERASGGAPAPTPAPGGFAQPPPPPIPTIGDPNQKQRPVPKILTHFLGETESLHFTTLSHVRTAKDAKESDQAEVGYFLKPCKSRVNPKWSSNCLWRRTSPLIDEKVNEGGAEIVLLENVEEFKLKYFGPDREEWVEVWKTDDTGDAISKGRFPTPLKSLFRSLTRICPPISASSSPWSPIFNFRITLRKAMKRRRSLINNERGSALLMAMFCTTLLMVIAMEIMYESSVEFQVSSQSINEVKASYAARAGAEISLLRLHIYKKAMAQFGSAIPNDKKSMLDPIWQMPYAWPPSFHPKSARSIGKRSKIR